MKDSELGLNVVEDYIAKIEEMLRQEASLHERRQEHIHNGSYYIAAREKFDDEMHIVPIIQEIEARSEKLGKQVHVDFMPDTEAFRKVQENVYSAVREQKEFDVALSSEQRLSELNSLPVTVMGVTYSEHSGKDFLHIVQTTGIIFTVDIVRECPLNWHEMLNSDVDTNSITDGSDELAIVIAPVSKDKHGRLYAEYRKDQIVMPFSKIAGVFEAKL